MPNPSLIISAGVKYDGKGLNKARKDVHRFGRDVRNLGKLFGVALSTGAILAFAKKSVDAFAKEEQAASRLAGVLENTGQAFAVMGVEKSLRNIELLTGETGDLRVSFTQLYLILKDVGAATTALNIAEDISAGTGIDILTISTALAKAYKGNTKSIKALIPSLSDATLASKDSYAITEALIKLYGGAAAKNATTFTGKLKILAKGFEEVKKSIGKGLVDSLMLATGSADVEALQKKIIDFGVKAGNAITTLAQLFKDNMEIIKTAAVALAAIFVYDKITIFATVAVTALTKVVKAMKILRTMSVTTAIAQMGVLNPLGAALYAAGLIALIYGASKAMDALTSSSEKAGAAVAAGLSYNDKRMLTLQKKADEKRLKDAAKAAKAQIAAQAKIDKQNATLKAAAAILDLKQISIAAALKNTYDAETRARLLLMQAIEEDKADLALQRMNELQQLQQSSDMAKLSGINKISDTQLQAINTLFIAELQAINTSKMNEADRERLRGEALNKYYSAVTQLGGLNEAQFYSQKTQTQLLQIAQLTSIDIVAAAQRAADDARYAALLAYINLLNRIPTAGRPSNENPIVLPPPPNPFVPQPGYTGKGSPFRPGNQPEWMDDYFPSTNLPTDMPSVLDTFPTPSLSTRPHDFGASGGDIYVTVNTSVVGSEQALADAIQTTLQNLNRYGTSINYAGNIAI